jgi:hypothetical protein
MRVAWGVDCSHSGTFYFEGLAVDDRLLSPVRRMLENAWRKIGVHAEEIRNSTGVVTVPVSEEHIRQREATMGQSVPDQVRPFGNSLASVDDQTLCPCPDDIRIRPLEGKLSDAGLVSIWQRS